MIGYYTIEECAEICGITKGYIGKKKTEGKFIDGHKMSEKINGHRSTKDFFLISDFDQWFVGFKAERDAKKEKSDIRLAKIQAGKDRSSMLPGAIMDRNKDLIIEQKKIMTYRQLSEYWNINIALLCRKIVKDWGIVNERPEFVEKKKNTVARKPTRFDEIMKLMVVR